MRLPHEVVEAAVERTFLSIALGYLPYGYYPPTVDSIGVLGKPAVSLANPSP